MENMNNFNNIFELSVKTSSVGAVISPSVGAVISPSDMFSINLVTDSDTEKYRSVWQQTHYDNTDKNNNVFSINLNDSDTKINWSVWRQPHYDIIEYKNNFNFEAFDIQKKMYIIRFAAKLAMMSVSAFINAVILYSLFAWTISFIDCLNQSIWKKLWPANSYFT